MQIHNQLDDHADDFVDVFRQAFSHTEGPEEGAVIAALVKDLLQTPASELHLGLGLEQGRCVAGVIYSRINFAKDPRKVFLLSPMAVIPQRHGQGLGQSLIAEGLKQLREQGANVVLTYGDPNFYGRLGFEQLSQDDVPPPYPLQQPHGWLGQTLDGKALEPALPGPSHCVSALANPDYW